jgi:hypothetical protein
LIYRLAAFLFLFTWTAFGDELTPPDVVMVQSVRVLDGMKSVAVGNKKGSYTLTCNMKAAGCLSPLPGRSYYVFDKSTHWRMPGAKVLIGLDFVQDWTVSYKEAENIGLVPTDGGGPDELGLYMLGAWAAK